MNIPTRSVPTGRPAANAGFTMVEIALCMAIVGFALVAILGVLPSGLSVQRANRDDTTILQEGNFLIEGIRNGARNLTALTNCVDTIAITNSQAAKFQVYSNFTTGYDIIGLLTTPRYTYANNRITSTNTVVARCRALSGTAAERGVSASAREMAFSYLVFPEITPYSAYPSNLTNWAASGLNAGEKLIRSNNWRRAYWLGTNLYEVRLTLRWPVRPNGTAGLNSQTFRTLVSGSLLRPNLSGPHYFFLPSDYGYQQ